MLGHNGVQYQCGGNYFVMAFMYVLCTWKDPPMTQVTDTNYSKTSEQRTLWGRAICPL